MNEQETWASRGTLDEVETNSLISLCSFFNVNLSEHVYVLGETGAGSSLYGPSFRTFSLSACVQFRQVNEVPKRNHDRFPVPRQAEGSLFQPTRR